MNKYLTKADFLAGITLKPVDHEVEGVGLVQVRGLGLMELNEVSELAKGSDFLFALHSAHRGLCNPQLSVEDLEVLGKTNPNAVSGIGKKALELSGRGESQANGPLAGNGSSPS